jgi:hypothetical protein
VLPPASAFFLSLPNATVQHIYFFSQTQKPMHKKNKRAAQPTHQATKKADTQAEAK